MHSRHNHHNAAKYLQNLDEFCDFWHVSNPDLIHYSWFHGRRNAARLDFFLIKNANSITQDKHREKMMVVIEYAKQKYTDLTPALKWELIKCEITGFCRVISMEGGRSRKNILIS